LLIAAVVIALAGCAAAAAPATAALKAIWGPTTLPNGQSAFPVYRDLGVDVVQYPLSWRDIAVERPANPRDPADPAYRWPADLDDTIAGAERSGMRVLLMMMWTPDWAGGRGGARASKPRDLADFATAAARRYPAVRHWMVWGEPSNHMRPMPVNSPRGPRVYARMLDRTYGALKRVRRSNVVIGGNTWTAGRVTPGDWVRWMRLPNGRPPRLDWFGHNPFGWRYPRLRRPPFAPGVRDMSDVDTLHRQLRSAYRAIGRRTPRLWLSEFSISSDRDNRIFNFHVSRRGQARFLRAAFGIARRNGWIAGIGWWRLFDEPPSVPGYTNNGLLTHDGRQKPAYDAYKRTRVRG
jgi:hypothetical protein